MLFVCVFVNLMLVAGVRLMLFVWVCCVCLLVFVSVFDVCCATCGV